MPILSLVLGLLGNGFVLLLVQLKVYAILVECLLLNLETLLVFLDSVVDADEVDDGLEEEEVEDGKIVEFHVQELVQSTPREYVRDLRVCEQILEVVHDR